MAENDVFEWCAFLPKSEEIRDSIWEKLMHRSPYLRLISSILKHHEERQFYINLSEPGLSARQSKNSFGRLEVRFRMQSKEKRGQLAETWRPGRDLQLHVLRFSDLGPALGFFGGDLVLEESDIELFGDGNASLGKYRLIRLEGSRLDVVNDAVMQLVRPASS